MEYLIKIAREKGYNESLEPTLYELHKWLREQHNLYVEILVDDNNPYSRYFCRPIKLGYYFTLSHDGVMFDNYEDALEAGLITLVNTIGQDDRNTDSI